MCGNENAELHILLRSNKADKLAFVSEEPYEYRRCPVHQTKVGKLSSVPTIYPVALDIVLRQNQPGKLTPAPEVPYEFGLC